MGYSGYSGYHREQKACRHAVGYGWRVQRPVVVINAKITHLNGGDDNDDGDGDNSNGGHGGGAWVVFDLVYERKGKKMARTVSICLKEGRDIEDGLSVSTPSPTRDSSGSTSSASVSREKRQDFPLRKGHVSRW